MNNHHILILLKILYIIKPEDRICSIIFGLILKELVMETAQNGTINNFSTNEFYKSEAIKEIVKN